MEPRKLCSTQQTMEHMTHLMEEHRHVVMAHQCWLLRRGLSEHSVDGDNGVAPGAVEALIPRADGSH